MYKRNRILCVIPARRGSKGLPGKNIKKLNGKPLIAYTIEHARKSKYIDRIIVSTDSLKIARLANKYGAETPFLRPKKLSTDNSGTIDVLLHAVDWMEKNNEYSFDILVLLHVTNPLRSHKDIDKAIEILFKKNADNLFSVTESHRNPYFNMVEVIDNKIQLVKNGHFVTRQSAPKVFDLNASIYIWRKDILKNKKSIFSDKTCLYLMPKERSVDIDDAFDFKIAQMLLRENKS